MGKKGENKKLGYYAALFIIISGVIAAGIVWYANYSRYISTDDSHVDSDNVSVSSKIMGRISSLYAEEGDSVAAGSLLAVLDSTDLVAQKELSLALRSQTEASLTQAEAKLLFDQKNIRVMEISLARAEDDYERAQNQYSGDVISKEQFDHIRSARDAARAQLDASLTQLQVSKTQVASARKAVESADAQINLWNTQISNTRLYAPVSGVIAKKWLLPGDVIQPGQLVYTVNDNSRFWIIVYLEETKIGSLKVGQKAKFTIDAFEGETFTGKIFAIGSNTASQFSLIPASNASGNFTKVTQRVPLKISIDGTESGKALSSYRVLSGMSSVVKIYRY